MIRPRRLRSCATANPRGFPVGLHSVKRRQGLLCSVPREIEARGTIETAEGMRQRLPATFVCGIARMLVQNDPAEKLGALQKPLRKGCQPSPIASTVVTATTNALISPRLSQSPNSAWRAGRILARLFHSVMSCTASS